MNQKIQRQDNAFASTQQYGINNPFVPVVPRVTALFTELTNIRTALGDYEAAQINNRAGFRGAVTNRQRLRDDTLEAMRELNKIARALNQAAFPLARDHFRMPASISYANVAAGARSFATHAEAMEAAFTDRGRPATFVADLRAMATALETGGNVRQAGKTAWVGATAALEAKAREGVAVLRELDAIITPLIADDAELLATWKSAVHIEADPVSAPEEETPPGSGTVAAAGTSATTGEGGTVA